MYKTIKIDEKEYKIEYSIEASLYADCTKGITDLFADAMEAEDRKDVKALLAGYANIPQLAITLFYAGLLEHHGNTEFGDGTVTSLSDAKRLVSKYIRQENEDGTKKNFYSIMQECMEQMGEDGFFELIGLAEMISQPTETEKQPKVPQDHKKKATTKK